MILQVLGGSSRGLQPLLSNQEGKKVMVSFLIFKCLLLKRENQCDKAEEEVAFLEPCEG